MAVRIFFFRKKKELDEGLFRNVLWNNSSKKASFISIQNLKIEYTSATTKMLAYIYFDLIFVDSLI